MNNIFKAIPETIEQEVFEDLLHSEGVRIERILSKGQASPETGWFDQAENEWVIVLQGAGIIGFEDGSEVRLEAGDWLNIKAHRKHRVVWTNPNQVTVWLAVFYQ